VHFLGNNAKIHRKHRECLDNIT